MELAEGDCLPRLIELKESFKYVEDDKDQGLNVRVRSETILQLLQNPSALARERQNAAKQVRFW